MFPLDYMIPTLLKVGKHSCKVARVRHFVTLRGIIDWNGKMRAGMEHQYYGFKFRKKLILIMMTLLVHICCGEAKAEGSSVDQKCGDNLCINGDCTDGNCTCYAGWKGPSCQLCGGRVR